MTFEEAVALSPEDKRWAALKGVFPDGTPYQSGIPYGIPAPEKPRARKQAKSKN